MHSIVSKQNGKEMEEEEMSRDRDDEHVLMYLIDLIQYSIPINVYKAFNEL